jgi:molecular chaperone GrpE
MEEKTPIVEKQDDVAELRLQREELLTKLKYLQAEFENYRKRAERDMESVVKYAHEALITRLLPVVDELDAAVETLKGGEAEGIRMVRDNLLKSLREAGLQEIPAKGLMFDPYVMDCVQQVPDPTMQDGVVKEVVLKGYRLHDRVLRPAHVVVVRNRGETNG